jgi:hypothetical protein
MPIKKGAALLAFRLAGNAANREKYAGSGYFQAIGAMGGRATRGISKHHGVNKKHREPSRKIVPELRSGLENATMQEVLAELER